jgi:hypothetical protein
MGDSGTTCLSVPFPVALQLIFGVKYNILWAVSVTDTITKSSVRALNSSAGGVTWEHLKRIRSRPLQAI